MISLTTSLRPLGEVAKVISGYAFKSAEFGEEGVPVIKIKNIRIGSVDLSEPARVERRFLSLDSKYHVMPGDLLISLTGSHLTQPNSVVGRVARLGLNQTGCLLNQRAGKIFLCDPDNADLDYLYYVLSTPDYGRQIALMAGGAANQANISPTQVESLEIPLPDLPTQRKIAGILSAYDDLIENNLRRIRILEEMAQSLYREWFVHFRYPGHESVPLVDSPLGPIPKGWEVKKMGELYKTSSGGTPSRKKTEYFEGGTIDWVKTGELRDGFVLSTEERITPEALKSSSAKLFPSNTVLIALYGATIGQLGVLSCEASTNQACCAFLEIQQPFGRAFAFLTMRTRREEIIGLRLGAAQQNISQAILRDFQVVCAPTRLLELFNSRVEPTFDLLLNLQRRNQTLRQTRDLLLPKLLSNYQRSS